MAKNKAGAKAPGKGGAKGKGKGREDKPDVEEVTEIPNFRDEEGVLLTLKSRDFPRSVEGQQAYCDYQIEKWEQKKENIAMRNDPQRKAKAKLEKYKKMIEKLEKELEEEGDDE